MTHAPLDLGLADTTVNAERSGWMSGVRAVLATVEREQKWRFWESKGKR